MRRLRARLLPLFIATTLCCSARVNAPPDLLLITLDTTRADHLSAYGYFRNTTPALDSLAARSILFEDCITSMATTLPAHASLLTGLYPIEHGVFANVADEGHPFRSRAGVRSLAEVLQQGGYATGGFVSAAPLSALTGIAAGFDVYDEPDGKERPARETIARAREWLASVDGPSFTWIHLFDPHSPYLPPEPYDTMFQTDDALARHMEERGIEPQFDAGKRRRDTRETLNAYDGEIRAMDDEIGRLLGWLRASGRGRNTVIAVIGDHGEGLSQHERWSHGELWHEQLAVPALFTGPGIEPRRVATTMSVVDFLPTVLTRFSSIPAQEFLDQSRGENVMAEHYRPRPVVSQLSDRRVTRFEAPSSFALTAKDWKIVYPRDEPAQLYRRVDDPHEKVDVADEYPDLVTEYEPVARFFTARYDSTKASYAGTAPPAVPEEYREKMRALGYLD